MLACQPPAWSRGFVILVLLVTGSYAASAPFKAFNNEAADQLVAAAQSALQQAHNNTSGAQDDDSGLGRHRGDSFTSPVDGYFIQVRVGKYAVCKASLAVTQSVS